LGLGLSAGVWLSFARVGPPSWEAARLLQFHGLTQSAGWIGLVVAGMSLRLVPRLTHQRPPPGWAVALVWAALAGGLGLRLAGIAGGYTVVSRAGSGLAALGDLAVAALLLAALKRAQSRGGWWWAALAGSLGWVLVGAIGAQIAASSGSAGLVPVAVESRLEWALLLGVGANFAWAIEARMVGVLFGRGQPRPRLLLLPLLAFNAGLLLHLGVPAAGPLSALLLGLGMLFLAPTVGALRGRAHRLAAASAGLGPNLVWAGRMAVLAGGLFSLGGVVGLWGGSDDALLDAGLHATGLGFLTVLIAGMMALLAPILARDRGRLLHPERQRLTLYLLLGAVGFRVLAPLLAAAGAATPEPLLLAAAGALAWLAMALFALTLIEAARSNP